MKLYLLIGGEKRRVALPERTSSAAQTSIQCPACTRTFMRVLGMGLQVSADDTAYETAASCVDCNTVVGTLRLETDTLFGLREDEAVTQRTRVY